MNNMSTIIQLVRIIMQWAGGTLFGASVASGSDYQALVGGVVSVLSGIWWAWSQYKAIKNGTAATTVSTDKPDV